MKNALFLFMAFILFSFNSVDGAGGISGKITNVASGAALPGVTVQAELLGIPVGTTTTNSSGNYSFPSLNVGTYSVVATIAGFQSVTNNVVVVLIPVTSNFQMAALGSVSGIITNNSLGTPLGGSTVQMIQSGTVFGSAITAQDGSYSITGLAPGSYTLSVSETHFQNSSAAVAITSSINSLKNLSLIPNTGSVGGAISSSSSLLGLPGATLTFTLNGTTVAQATSGLLGLYSVSSLPPATYTVSVNLANYQTATGTAVVTSDTTTPLNINLTFLNGILSGTILDSLTNNPIPSVTVTVMQGTSLIGTTQSGSLGTYSLPNLSPGNYTVNFSSGNYQTASGSVTISPNLTTVLNSSLQPNPGSVAGLVINNQTSAALGAATVTVSSGLSVLATTTTNTLGQYSISGLAVGSYTLTVSFANFVSFSQNITITSGATLTQNCSLIPQVGIVVGVVQDLNSLSLLGGETVQLFQGNTLVDQTTTSLAGLYTFSALPGSYTIKVSGTNYVSATLSATLLSNVTVTVNVSLIANPGSLSGQVINALTLNSLSNATIQILQGSVVVASTTTNGSGAYSITGLSPGSYTLSASLSNYLTGTSIVIIASNATTTANLSLAPQNGSANGQVINSVTSAVIPGAAVSLYQGSALVGSTTTDGNGNYSFPSLIPGSYTLKAILLNYQLLTQPINIQSNVATVTNISLSPLPGIVSGVVLNAQTAGVLSGATVVLSQSGSVIASTVANSLGAYSFPSVVPGSYTATASLTNFTSASQTLTVNSSLTTPENFSLQPQSGTVTGQISSSLTASALASVTINAVQGSTIVATTTTDVNGNYTLSLIPGSYTISGILSNYLTSTGSVNIQSNASITLNTTLTPVSGSISGIVTSLNGLIPLNGVSVSVMQGSVVVASTQTNVLGSYTLSNLSPGTYSVLFSLNTYQSLSQSAVLSSNQTTTLNVALSLQPGSISGVITNGLTNTPLNGASLTAMQGSVIIETTTSGSNGSYQLLSLPVGSYTLSVTASNFQTATLLLVVVAPNAVTPINVTLLPISGSVTGIITDSATTNPISGATVSAMQNGILIESAITSISGSYTLSGLAPGTYSLVVNVSNYQSVNAPLTIVSNAQATASFSLSSAPGGIGGFVKTAASFPISGATVQVLNGSSVIATAITAGDGSYTITGLAPEASGVYVFRASAPNFQTQVSSSGVIANAITPVSFSLASLPGTLTGTITNLTTGAPISSASVQISEGIMVIGSSTTDSNGTYSIPGLSPGAYTISVSASSFQTVTQGASISANVVTTVNISLLPNPGSLIGTILDSATSSPLMFATVSIWNQNVLVASTLTLANGTYSLTHLVPGNYTAIVSDANYQNGSTSVTIFSNQTATLNLSLASLPGFISGTVLSGVSPVSGASIAILQGNTTVNPVITDVNGNYTSLGLSPGTYTVTASAPNLQSFSNGANVLASLTTPVNFNLASDPGSISGVLKDAVTHLPISSAIVTALSGNIVIGSSVTLNDGSYSIGGLSPGVYIVTAVALNYQTLTQGAVVLANAQATLNLSLASLPGGISGQVIDALTLTGISGATVNISQGNIIAASVLTDTNGFYSGTGLAPGFYNVSCQASHYQNSVQGTVILPSAVSTLNFALLNSPGTISGQILDASTDPLPGSLVNIYINNLLIGTQIADSQGNFSFGNLSPGAYVVTSSSANYQSESQAVSVEAGLTTSIVLHLTDGPGSCACVILDAATALPLPGANVSIWQGNAIVATLITNSLGECSFLGITPGSYVIRASASNYQIGVVGLNIQSLQITNVSLSLQVDPGSISGVVNDLITGFAIQTATIDVVSGGMTVLSVTTDSSGNYLLDSLAPGVYSIRVSALNYQTSLYTAVVLANTVVPFNLGLQPAPGSISVTVSDSISLNPISGAVVTIFNPLSNVPITTGITDVAGNCLINGIAPGSYTALIQAVNYQSFSLGVTAIGNVTLPLTINLIGNPGSIQCLVLDGLSLLPVSGCLVEAFQNQVEIASQLTSSLGICQLAGLVSGSYTVRITAPNYQITSQVVIVAPNAQASITIDLINDSGILTGSVLDVLSLLSLPGAQVTLLSGETLIATTISDALGNFSFTGLSPGTYTLLISLLNFETFSISVTITAHLTTHQPCPMHSHPGNITGTVLDAASSNPISGASVTVLNGSSSIANVLTDSSGNYTVQGLSPNVNYTVRCSANNYQTAIQGITVQPSETKTVNFNLNAQVGSVVGQVVSAATSGELANAKIDLLQGSILIASTFTDALGNYQFASVAGGSYTLRASVSLFQMSVVSVNVQTSLVSTVNFSLQANPGAVQGVVYDALTSLPLSNAQVQLQSGSLVVGAIATDQNGSYSLGNLAPGQYTIIATAPNYQTFVQTALVQSNVTATVNFSLLSNPGSIIGTVTANGSPITGATLSLYQNATLIATATTDNGGGYLLSNLAQGQYSVVVSANGFQNATQGVQIQANAATSVNFSLLLSPGNIIGVVSGAPATIDLLQGGISISSIATASDGSFSFSNLAPGNYTLRVQAPNFQTAIIGAIVTQNATTVVNITLIAQNGTVIGTVQDSSSALPLSNALIEILQNSVVIESSLTDQSGNYSMTGLAPGNYLVRATKNAYQIAIQGVQVQSNVERSVNFSLNLNPGSLSGQLTDAVTGSLIVDAEIDILKGTLLVSSTATDGNGNYLINNLAPGDYMIRASLTHYETSVQSATVTASNTTVVNFALSTQPGFLEGQITDATTNQPILTAFVAVNLLQGNVTVGSSITDSGGNYVINGLAQGTYTLQISAPNYQTVSQGVTITAQMGTIANVALQENPGAISGSITDLTTTLPISGAVVSIMQGSSVFETVLSDSSGNYSVSQLAAGNYEILVQAENYETTSQTVIVQINTTTLVNISLASDPGSLTGTLTDESLNPLSGAVIQIANASGVISTAISDASGNYTITGLKASVFTVYASASNYQTAFSSVGIEPNAVSHLSFVLLSQPGAITGQIVDLATSIGISSASVVLLQNGTVAATVLTDANGNYTLSGLAPNSYTLRVRASGYQIINQGVSVLSSQTVTLNLGLLSLPGSVNGTVLDAFTLSFIPGVSVEIFQGSNVVNSTMTDSNGVYNLTSLAPGSYTIQISAPNYQNFSQGVSVAASAVTTCNASLNGNPLTVRGVVTAVAGGSLIAQAAVQVRQGNTVVGSTLTDEGGAFAISGLGAGSYQLSVFANDYQSSLTTFTVVSGDITVNISLNLNPGTLSGTVIDSITTLPIGGANIVIQSQGTVIASQISDANGSWLIANLAPGLYTVVINAPSYQTAILGATVEAGSLTALSAALTSQPGEVIGQVSSDTSSIGGASVEVFQGNTVIGSALTDAAGSFAIGSLPPGSYSLKVSKAGFVTAIQGILIQANLNTQANFILTLGSGSVTGQVVDAITLLPISGVSIQLVMAGNLLGATVTDANGNYQILNMAQGSYTLMASSFGYQTVSQGVMINSNQTSLVNLRLQNQPGEVSGQIVDQLTGLTLSGASISLLSGQTVIASSISDTNGNYTLTGITAGNYVIRAGLNTYQFAIQSVSVTASLNTVLNFSLSSNPGSISGQVTDIGGTPITSGSVVLHVVQNNTILASTLTDSNGTYLINNLPQGSYSLSVMANGYQSASANVLISQGLLTLQNFELSLQPGALQGTIEGAGGNLAGAAIQLFQNGNAIASTLTDSNGHYFISNLASGQYALQITASPFQSANLTITINVNATTTANATLQSNPGSITGSVTDFVTGVPLSGFSVNVAANSQMIATAITDGNGNFQINGLVANVYTVSITGANYQTYLQQVSITAGNTVQVNAALLLEPGSVSGFVVDTSSTPIANVRIEALIGTQVVAFATTDSQGVYLLSGLSEGNYVLRATAVSYQIAFVGATVYANADAVVSFILQNQPGSITGVIQDAGTLLPIGNASIALYNGSIQVASTTSSSNGQYTMPSVPVGSYVLQAVSLDYVIENQGVTVESNAALIVNFLLNGNPGSVIGQVIDAATMNPINNAAVVLYQGSFFIRSVQTDGNGNYSMGNLAPGTYTVIVSSQGLMTAIHEVSVVSSIATESNFFLNSLAGAISGSVVDSSSLPIGGAYINILFNQEIIGAAVTDSNGNYSINGLGSGNYSVSVSKTNYISASKGIFVSVNATANVSFVLNSDPGSVQVLVRDSFGTPINAAAVEVLQNQWIIASALTDGNGNVTIGGLDVNSVTVRVSKDGYGTSLQTAYIVSDLTTVLSFDLSRELGQLSGTVEDQITAALIPNAAVEVWKGSLLIANALTDANGAFSISGLSPGSYTVHVSADNYQMDIESISLSNQSTVISIRLLDQPGSVSGTITDSTSGLGISGAFIQIVENTTIIATLQTDSDGNYLINNLAQGSYVLSASVENYQTAISAVTIVQGSLTQLNISLNASPLLLTGVVNGSNSELPISNATLQVYSETILIASSMTDSQGSYTVTGLKPGTYQVNAVAEGYQASIKSVTLSSGLPRELDFSLVIQDTSITGIIQDSTSNFIRGASISLYEGSVLIASTLSDANGAFIFSSVGPGFYTLVVESHNYQTYLQNVHMVNVNLNVMVRLITSPGEVQGTIFDATSNAGIGGASIQILNGQTPIASTLTDAQGNFTIQNLPVGYYVITVNAPNYQTAALGIQIVAGQTDQIELGLQLSPATITGNVVNSASSPIASATVSLLQGSTTISSVMTDANGNYTINGIASGSYTLEAIAPSYQWGIASIDIQAGSTASLNFSLEANPGSLQGVVTDGINPIKNVFIQIFNGSTVLASTFTDDLGAYGFVNLAPGSYNLHLSLSGYQTVTAGLSVSAGAAQTANFALLALPSTLSGTVINAASLQPLPGVIINSYYNNILIAALLTDANGNYVMAGLPAGSYIVIASLLGFEVTAEGVIILPNSTEMLNFSLLASTSQLIGVLQDSAGSPIASGTITVLQNNNIFSSTTSNGDGSYLITGLKAGSYTVTAAASQYQANTQGIIIIAGQTAALNFTLLSDSSSLSGHIVNSALGQIASANISLFQMGNLVAQGLSANDGSFSINGLGTGSFSVLITASGYQTLTAGIILSAGEPLVETFSLLENSGSIQGRVKDLSNDPLPRANISVMQGSTTLGTALTDSNGAYSITGLGAGSYVVTCSLTGYQTLLQGAIVSANAITLVDFTLGVQTGTLQGTLTDAALGTPISFGSVSIYSQGIFLTSVAANASGFYLIDGLKPGSYTITIQANGYQTIVESVLIPLNMTIDVSIGLISDPGSIQGVVESNQLPIANAMISVSALQGNTLISSTVTDANGNYILSGLQPGSYVIKAMSAGYQMAFQDVLIASNQTETINFILIANPGEINGNVIDALTLNPVGSASIQILQGSIVLDTGVSDSQGNFIFSTIPTGTYNILVNAVNYQINIASIQVASGQTVSLTISLEQDPGSVQGTVLDNSSNLPIRGAVIDLIQGVTLIASTLTDANGNYILNQLPPGSYSLRATATNYQSVNQGCSILPNDTITENFVLSIEPGTITGVVRDASTTLAISGASIAIMQGNNAIANTLTDSSGAFTITGLKAASYTIQTTIAAYQNNVTGVALELNQTLEVDIALQSNPGRVDGSVTNQLMQPISGAQVTVFQGNVLVAQVLTNSSGLYTIANLGEGSYVIQASSGNVQTQAQGVSVVAGGLETVNFVLQANPGGISGVILSATSSSGIAGVSITILSGGSTVASAVTSSNGGYAISGLSSGTYTVSAAAPQFQSATLVVNVTAGTVATADISLQGNPGTFLGIVSNSGGSGINGAQVNISLNGASIATAVTSATGSYQVTGLQASTYTITVIASGYQTLTLGASVQAAQTVTENMMLQSNPGQISGHVTDQNTGLSLPNAGIQLTQNNIIILSVLSDAQGDFLIENVALGTYVLRVSGANFQSVTESVAVLPNQTTLVTISLPENPGRLQGVIMNPSMQPISNVNIQVFQNSMSIGQTVTNSNGEYSMTGLPPGVYTLTAGGQGYGSATVTAAVTANQTTVMDITLTTEQGTISGAVMQSVTGNLLLGATVDLFSGTNLIAVAQTDANGLYFFDSVTPGNYTLRVSAQNDQTLIDPITVQNGQNTLANEILSPLPGSFNGTVSNAITQELLKNVLVTVYGGEFPIATTLTDAFGNYSFTNLSPGSYTVVYSLSTYETSVENVTISANAVTTFNLLLDPIPSGPLSVLQCTVKNTFAFQSQYANHIEWKASLSPVAMYNIYRDGVLYASVLGKVLFYNDYGQCKHNDHTYQVSAVNSLGIESARVDAVFSSCKCKGTIKETHHALM